MKFASMATVEMSVDLLLKPQLEFLSENGFEIEAISKQGSAFSDPSLKPKVLRRYVEIERELAPLSDLQSLFRLVRLFKAERYQIVNTHTPKAGLLGPLAAQIAGVPIVIHTVHGLLFHDQMSAFRKSLAYAVEKFTSLFSDYLFFQSQEDLDWVVKNKFFDQKKCFYIGNGINLQRFDPLRSDLRSPADLRQELKIPEEAFVVGTVARLVHEKGFRELFASIQKLHTVYPKMHFVIVGGMEPDQNDAMTQREIDELQSKGRIHFLGARRDVDALYRVMNLFVLLSYREGIPRALMEAQAMGLPAVATDIRGIREVIVPEQTGLLVPVKDADASLGAMQSLIQDSARRHEMGRRAGRYAHEHFGEQKVHARLKAALHTILSDRARGS